VKFQNALVECLAYLLPPRLPTWFSLVGNLRELFNKAAPAWGLHCAQSCLETCGVLNGLKKKSVHTHTVSAEETAVFRNPMYLQFHHFPFSSDSIFYFSVVKPNSFTDFINSFLLSFLPVSSAVCIINEIYNFIITSLLHTRDSVTCCPHDWHIFRPYIPCFEMCWDVDRVRYGLNSSVVLIWTNKWLRLFAIIGHTYERKEHVIDSFE
jgi:hypothetical protein